MKRTLAGVVLLAGLGCASTQKSDGVAEGAAPFGGASAPKPVAGVQGPMGEPVAAVAARGQMPGDTKRADSRSPGRLMGGEIKQTAGFARVDGGCATGNCAVPGVGGDSMMGGGLPSPTMSGLSSALGHGGILPVPAMGAYGAVAAIGANGPGSGMYGGMYANTRTSVRFTNPAGMKIAWQTAPGVFTESGLEAPARYNFPQGTTYRLRLSGVPTRPGRQFYPTLEVYPATIDTVTFLSHSTVPVTFTDEDFDQVAAGNLVIKVIYLPSERFQDLAAVAGAEEIVSTRLDPGVNPVQEANRRGTILAVIRIGNIDLQDPNTPPPDSPSMGGMGLPPGAVPVNGAKPSAMPTTPVPSAPVPPTGGVTGASGSAKPGALPSFLR